MEEADNLLTIKGAEDAPVAAPMAVAMIALNMALKYHDINTVQDGALYQQYKLEGKNMTGLHLDHVFETARRIERHLLISSREISEIMVTGVIDALQAAVGEDRAADASTAE